jgi:hypothetical protein
MKKMRVNINSVPLLNYEENTVWQQMKKFRNKNSICEISGSHTASMKMRAFWDMSQSRPVFQRCVLPPTSG